MNLFPIGSLVIFSLSWGFLTYSPDVNMTNKKILFVSLIVAVLIHIFQSNYTVSPFQEVRTGNASLPIKQPGQYPLTAKDEDYAKTGLRHIHNWPQYALIQEAQFGKPAFPAEDVQDVLQEQRYNDASDDPIYKLKNYENYLKSGFDGDQVEDLVELNDKLSRFKKLYNQHNHVQWTPHTHVGKYIIKENLQKHGYQWPK